MECVYSKLMRTSKSPKKARSKRVKKQRTNISLTPEMMEAAALVGEKTFGSRTGYIEHLLLNDLRAQGLTLIDILKLASGEAPENHSAKDSR